MKKAAKLLVLLAVPFFLFIAVVLVAFYHLIQAGELRRFLIEQTESKTDLRLALGKADIELGWISGISFSDVALSAGDGSEPLFTAARITARVALFPLLERKVVLYEIHATRPAGRLDLDATGDMPLLDRLLQVPFFKHEDGAIQIDVRAVRIDDGRIDVRPKSGGAATSLRVLELELKRLGGQALRDFLRGAVNFGRERPEGAALDFFLRAEVDREGANSALRAAGRMIFPDRGQRFADAWWDMSVQARGIPASLVERYVSDRWPLGDVTGTLAPRLRIEGDLAERLQIRGQVDFKGVNFDAPGFFSAPVAPGDGTIAVDLDWKPGAVTLARASVDSSELRLTASGSALLDGKNERRLRFELQAPGVRAALLKKYLPLKLPELEGWREIIAAVSDGDVRIRSAGLTVTLPDSPGRENNDRDRQFWLDTDVRNLRLDPIRHLSLPLRIVAGRLALKEGVVAFSDVQAHYGASRILALDGRYRAGAKGHGALELRGQAELDLAQLYEQLKSGAFPFGERIPPMALVSEIGGRGKLDVAASGGGERPLAFGGTLTLDGARLRYGDFSFTDLSGEVSLAPDEIKAPELRASISGAPAEIQFLAKDYALPSGDFDLRVESAGMKAGPVLQAVFGSGSVQDAGIVRGWVRYRGQLAANRHRKLTGSLDLVNVQIAMPPLAQPLRGVTGKLRIEESAVEFQNIKAVIAGFASTFNGRWRYDQQPQLFFDLAFPKLDLDDLLSRLDREPGGFYDQLHAVGRLSIENGRFKAFEFSDLNTDLVVERRVWRLSQLSARSAGGAVQGQAVISHRPERPAFALDGNIQGVPVQGFLNWIDAHTTEMTGKVSLSGRLESAGADAVERKRNLSGAFRLQIDDGTIHRFRILVQILNLLDLSRWFTLQVPDLGKQGIRFRSITGDFKVTQGVLATERLLVDSDDLRMTGAGKIDLSRDELDFILAVRPFAALDTAIHTIPIIGRGIAAIKNSFLVASFAVKGPIENPTITPAPLSTLSEVFYSVLGIPKKLIIDDSNNPGAQIEP